MNKNKNHNYNNSLVKNHVKGNIIDIGGGDLEKTKQIIYSASKNRNINAIMNVDNDINIVINNMTKSRYDSGGIQCGFLDFTKSYEEFNIIEKQLSVIDKKYNTSFNMMFDTLMMINSINFAFKNSKSISSFMNYINLFSKTGSKIIIRWMDFDAFLSKYSELRVQNCLEYSDSNNKILINSPYDSSFVNIDLTTNTNRIYYKWTHKTPIDEKLIGRDELKNLFKHNGWEFIDYEYQDNYKKINSNSNSWELYFKSFSFIVFQKN